MTKELMCPYTQCPVYHYYIETGNNPIGLITTSDGWEYSCEGIKRIRQNSEAVLKLPGVSNIVKGLVQNVSSECSHIKLLSISKSRH